MSDFFAIFGDTYLPEMPATTYEKPATKYDAPHLAMDTPRGFGKRSAEAEPKDEARFPVPKEVF